jgi:hypothetical protein
MSAQGAAIRTHMDSPGISVRTLQRKLARKAAEVA